MRKFSGLMVASFIVGLICPIACTGVILSTVFAQRELPEPETVTVELPASYTDVFRVEYDMYGSATIGAMAINATIANNYSNVDKCSIYLQDNGHMISEIKELSPGERILTLKMTWLPEERGEHNVTLVYEIGNSKIECPYIILLNGGTIDAEKR